MKNMFTLKQVLLSCLGAMVLLGMSFNGQAQTFFSNTAGFDHTAGGVNNPPSLYGPDHYNDNTRFMVGFPPPPNKGPIPAWPTSANDSFTFVNTNESIKIWWQNSIPVDFIDKIVFYKNNRPLTQCIIKHWDGTTWDTVVVRQSNGVRTLVYNDIQNIEADSVDIVGCLHHTHPGAANGSIFIQDNIVTGQAIDTIMITGVQTGLGGNPDFREIQLVRRTGCSGAPIAEIVGGVDHGPIVANSTNPILSVCAGYAAYFNAMSNWTDTGHYYQWQSSPSAFGPWTDIAGAKGPGYLYTAGLPTFIRVLDSCGVSLAPPVPSNVIEVTISPSIDYTPFTAAGYYMGFDNPWKTSACILSPYANDIPDDLLNLNNWSNSPPFGANSWRTDVAPNNAGWASQGSGSYSSSASTYPYHVSFPVASRKSARLHTAPTAFTPGWQGNLDLYMDFSDPNVAGDKALYFYYINQGSAYLGVNNDTLKVLMSTNGGSTWTLLGTFDTAQYFTKRMVPIPSNSAQTIIRFQGTKYNINGNENSDIGIDSIYIAAPWPCTFVPTAGKIRATTGYNTPVPPVPAGSVNVCPGSTLVLTTLGASMGGGLVYEWQQCTNGSTWSPVNGGYGSNDLFFRTPPVYDTVWYRLSLKCGTSGTPVYSDTIKVNLSSAGPTYASIPYSQNFETWINKCGTGDVPASTGGAINWTNSPYTGLVGAVSTSNSWRASNISNAASAGWNNLLNPPIPAAINLQKSARFHSSGVALNKKGMLDLLFDGSTANGSKELRFYYYNSTGDDSLEVLYSSDAGSNFTKLFGYTIAQSWTQYVAQIPCNSPNCVIRFQASGDLGNQSDIGIDSVTVTPPCSGTPVAGTLTSAIPCPGETFNMDLVGYSNTGGLIFYWEKSTDSLNWTLAQADTTKTYFTTNISQHTWFRVRVKCAHSGQESIAVIRIKVAEFYYCYCASGATNPTGADIGNVNIKRLPMGTNIVNNGTATPQNNNGTAISTYSDFRIGNPDGWLPMSPAPSVNPLPLYQDTLYHMFITQINSGNFQMPGTTVTVWIDTDRNGFFDTDEVFLQQNSINTTTPPQKVDGQFTLSGTTPVGITGMRIVMEQGVNANSLPCGVYGQGETEDYLVDIRYHPCDGPTNAGIVYQSDTAVCAGYNVTLVDTTHEKKRYGIRWVWQYSPDSNSWADISGSLLKDTVTHLVTAQTYYRVMMVCLSTFDTTYSNVVKVAINPPYACYCFSLADGGSNGDQDSSDIGGVVFKDISIPPFGPHLLNPTAVNSRTDYTKAGVVHLWADSTYGLLVYHTIKTGYHGDAKITLFMDLNNDLQYNIPSERLWTGYTTSTYFTVIDSITIPHYAFPGVMTGMRIILNNNTAPNIPSDSACGPYTSGETEDFVVMFHNAQTDVKDIYNISNLAVYPNPTTGKFNVAFEAQRAVEEATVTVTNITGQQIIKKSYVKPGKKMNEELDLSNMARGIYIVELKADNEKLVRKLIVR